jgi:hypothetical protein
VVAQARALGRARPVLVPRGEDPAVQAQRIRTIRA